MKQVVLTIDDRLIFNQTIIAPILKEYGFRCTFFITVKPEIWKELRGFKDMSIKVCKDLYDDGFEIANHTYNHWPISCGSDRFAHEIEVLDDLFAYLKIEKPVSFAYPGYCFEEDHIELGKQILLSQGYKYARLGYPIDQWHYDLSKRTYTPYFDPKKDDPFRIHTTGVLNKDYSFDYFKRDLESIPDNTIAVFSTHYVQNSYEINRLHQICRYIRDHDDVEMVCLKDIPIES